MNMTTKYFLGCNVVKQHHTLTQILMGLLNRGFEFKAVVQGGLILMTPAFTEIEVEYDGKTCFRQKVR